MRLWDKHDVRVEAATTMKWTASTINRIQTLLMQLELKRSDGTGAKARRKSSKASANVRSQAQGVLMEVAWSSFGTVLERRLEGNPASISKRSFTAQVSTDGEGGVLVLIVSDRKEREGVNRSRRWKAGMAHVWKKDRLSLGKVC
jgi:hypothetical protein